MITYKSSGVDIDKATKLVREIKTLSFQTDTNNVLSGIGGFNAAFTCPKHIKNPVFLATTDGVGTKIRLANKMKKYNTVGIDLVAMCVNDIICSGGDPLIFLDYYATGKLNLEVSKEILKGIVKGCQQSGCSLIGGETAEMPVVYKEDDWDIAGFSIGVVEHDKMITGEHIQSGDVLIGLPSSGIHSNGYSLINHILDNGIPDMMTDERMDSLLIPTKIYVSLIHYLMEKVNILGIANITGGGIVENVPRILPSSVEAKIDYEKIIKDMPPIFKWIQKVGCVTDKEMLRTFNCGIGMVICVRSNDVNKTLKALDKRGETGILVGTIVDE